MLKFFEFNFFLNQMWIVRSSFNKITTISNDITTKTMRFSKRNLIMTMFWTKISSISLNSIKKINVFEFVVDDCFDNNFNDVTLISIQFDSFRVNVFWRINQNRFLRFFLLFSKTKSWKLMIDSSKSNEIKMCLFLLKIRFNSFANKNKIIWYFWFFLIFIFCEKSFSNSK